LRNYQPAPVTISAVHPAGRRLPAKVRVFIDFLTDILAREPDLAVATL
jgi:LysR family transcriptional regulator for bpeEF and oprC